MEPSLKARENRVRRALRRQGWTLRKSRRRDLLALDYGLYRVEASNGDEAPAFASVMGWGWSLNELEEILADQREAARQAAEAQP